MYRYDPEPYRRVIKDKLMKSVTFTVDVNPEQWANYGAKPLPNWSWYGNYDEDWVAAEREWKGYLTVRNLKSLYDFGRIQKIS